MLNVLFMVEEAALDPVLEQHLMIKGVRVFLLEFCFGMIW